MALTNEDKKDVAGAMGKSVANKVDKATNDKAMGKKRDMAKKMSGYDKDIKRYTSGGEDFSALKSSTKSRVRKENMEIFGKSHSRWS